MGNDAWALTTPLVHLLCYQSSSAGFILPDEWLVLGGQALGNLRPVLFRHARGPFKVSDPRHVAGEENDIGNGIPKSRQRGGGTVVTPLRG
jgi:hypothetical protein